VKNTVAVAAHLGSGQGRSENSSPFNANPGTVANIHVAGDVDILLQRRHHVLVEVNTDAITPRDRKPLTHVAESHPAAGYLDGGRICRRRRTDDNGCRSPVERQHLHRLGDTDDTAFRLAGSTEPVNELRMLVSRMSE
jgi:hypothetical protein